MTERRQRACLVLICLAAALSACASPTAVRDLTREANGNIWEVSKSIQAFEKNSASVERKLAEFIDDVDENAAKLELRLKRNTEIWKLAGSKEKLAFLTHTLALADAIEKEESLASKENVGQRLKSILAALDSSKAPSAELKAVTEKLAELLKRDESFGNRLDALFDYGKDVAEEIKTAQKSAEKAPEKKSDKKPAQ